MKYCEEPKIIEPEIPEHPQNDVSEFVVNRILKFMELKHMSRYKLEKKTGISQASLSSMFKRKTDPSLSTLTRLCEGLNISVEEFFDSKHVPDIMTQEDKELLNKVYLLDDAQRNALTGFINGLITQKEIIKYHKPKCL